jgi:hypothetical protein
MAVLARQPAILPTWTEEVSKYSLYSERIP